MNRFMARWWRDNGEKARKWRDSGEIVARWKGFGGPLLYANPYGHYGQIVAKASTGDEEIMAWDRLFRPVKQTLPPPHPA